MKRTPTLQTLSQNNPAGNDVQLSEIRIAIFDCWNDKKEHGFFKLELQKHSWGLIELASYPRDTYNFKSGVIHGSNWRKNQQILFYANV